MSRMLKKTLMIIILNKKHAFLLLFEEKCVILQLKKITRQNNTHKHGTNKVHFRYRRSSLLLR